MSDKALPAAGRVRGRPPVVRRLIDDPGPGSTAGPYLGMVLALQRSVGNRAVAQLAARPSAPLPVRLVQRLPLEEGPPLAPGNYRYGPQIVSLDPSAMRTMLSDKTGREGLKSARAWEQSFAADMRAQSGKARRFEDPVSKQTVAVEPMLAARADDAQQQLDEQAEGTKTQFQQQLLVTVTALLDSSEMKLEAEGRRYGFPDTDSIFNPKQLSAGQAAVLPSMPGSEDLRGLIGGAKELLAGKKKLNAAREKIAKLGPILGDMQRPEVLEPAVKEQHELRQRVCGKFPILASIERDDKRLTELASGSSPPATGQAASTALQKARDEVRKELADKLSNISYIRDGMKEPDKIERFWLDASLRASAKRTLGIAPGSFHNAAIDDKVDRLQGDAAFEQRLKQAIGVALLVASFIPGVGPAAGAVGLLMGASDVLSAFQDYYWEQAAAGTAMEKAEAISQTEPSLFGLAFSIATGLLEGVAEAKALEGAIGVFKAVSGAYREARAASVAAKAASGAAKATGAAEAVAATERLRKSADTASSKPGLGDHLVASLEVDVKSAAMSLDHALKTINNPALKELILKGDQRVIVRDRTLMDLAIEDPHGLAADYAEWQRSTTSRSSGRSFPDWLRDAKQAAPHGVLHDPAGLLEYGLDEAGARRSYEACLRDDPTREAGIWRDPGSGEHVVVQGGPGYVEGGWMSHSDNLRNGQRVRWEMVVHHHPNRGLAIDRIPSQSDFAVITASQRSTGIPQAVRSRITWIDPVSKLRFETEFGFTPGAPRPYWTRYRVEDGTMRIASFVDPPFGAGNAAYQNFIDNFRALPSDPVPGGNLPPVAPPGRRGP